MNGFLSRGCMSVLCPNIRPEGESLKGPPGPALSTQIPRPLPWSDSQPVPVHYLS